MKKIPKQTTNIKEAKNISIKKFNPNYQGIL
jgi:hypothetical protein